MSATLAPDVGLTSKEVFLSDDEIQFIPNDDFTSASEEDFRQLDVQLYAEEEGRAAAFDRKDAAVSFLQAIDESRLLTFEGEQLLFKRLNFLRFRANAIKVTLPDRRPPKKLIREIDRLLAEAAATREEIARANLRLVCSIARKMSSGSPDEFDEYVGEANAILLNAIDKFDFSRGYRFSTYATHAVQRHLYRFIGRVSKRKGKETDSPVSIESASDTHDQADGPTHQDVMDAAETVLVRVNDVLDERERAIVLGRFGFNESGKSKTLRELGSELGLSKERVRQIQQLALEKLAEVAKPFESTFAQTE